MGYIKKTLLLIVGMPGAGKSVFVGVARKNGIPVYSMGDIVREEAKRRRVYGNDYILGKIAIDLRKKYGKDIIAKRVSEKIRLDTSKIVLIDGIRSLEEVNFFKKNYGSIKIIAVHASPKTRFKRLLRRNREDDPKDWESFVLRDYRELDIGIGRVIALADIMIVNENITLEEYYKKCRYILEDVIKV